MGAQIAAHLVNASVETLLFELPAKEGDPNGNVLKAIDNLRKLEPSPLSIKSKADAIRAANYEQNLEWLKDCDLVIEAIIEKVDAKQALFEKLEKIVGPECIVASNTSGLRIEEMTKGRGAALKKNLARVELVGVPNRPGIASEIFRLSQMPIVVEAITSKQFNAPARRPAYSVLSTDRLVTMGIAWRLLRPGRPSARAPGRQGPSACSRSTPSALACSAR
jgi:3-hydroxyacyl-CoA dehydrogenase